MKARDNITWISWAQTICGLKYFTSWEKVRVIAENSSTYVCTIYSLHLQHNVENWTNVGKDTKIVIAEFKPLCSCYSTTLIKKNKYAEISMDDGTVSLCLLMQNAFTLQIPLEGAIGLLYIFASFPRQYIQRDDSVHTYCGIIPSLLAGGSSRDHSRSHR